MSAILTPAQLRTLLPLSTASQETVAHTRQSIKAILDQKDKRLIVIVGPCSIHNPTAAITYAQKLQKKIREHKDHLCIVMRTYVEKSRTSLGWKGFINDPLLNNSFQIEKGLKEARKLFLQLNDLGVPVATEIVHPYVSLYLSDLTSWSAIGARTTESQLHREFASALSTPIGFKNNTNGDIQVAIDAVKTARESHTFFKTDLSGNMQLTTSNGNAYGHVVLRGASEKSNYDKDTIEKTAAFSPVIVDCSHGNSQKNHAQQLCVVKALSDNLENISGVMLESYLMAGKQSWHPDITPCANQSITDACIGWEDTEKVLDLLSNAVQTQRKNLLH
ncbi:MAG: 3-deoxy-7-phosphoheptulonate synthase [Coxiellaceae bacterium]|nr:3-deoxy-7-phosphoheptulonate synthase [Coxiellaceae bacterium]